MASCPASEQASISPSAKNMCADGKSLTFDFSCKPFIEKPSSTGDVVAAAETGAAASNGATGRGGGAGGGIGSNGGEGNSTTIKLSLGSRVGVNVAVLLVGIALI